MGKFGCTCGNSVSLNSIPEFNQAYLITDIALDNVAGDDVSADRLPKRTVIECDKCGRLWFEPTPPKEGSGYDYPFLSFIPEGKKLKFRNDYGKGYKEESPEDPSLFEPDPGDVEWRTVYVGAGFVELTPRERKTVKVGPMEASILVDYAVVPDETSSKILLHSSSLMCPTPIVAIFGVGGVKDGMRDVMRAITGGKLQRGPGETVDLDVENVGDEAVKFALGVVGRAKVPPKPFSTKEERASLIQKLKTSSAYGKFGLDDDAKVDDQTTDADLLRSLESDIVEFKPDVRKRLLDLAARLDQQEMMLKRLAAGKRDDGGLMSWRDFTFVVKAFLKGDWNGKI